MAQPPQSWKGGDAHRVVAVGRHQTEPNQVAKRLHEGQGFGRPTALLDLLRDYWREARPEGWLFPGKPKIMALSPRQLNRAFTSAKHKHHCRNSGFVVPPGVSVAVRKPCSLYRCSERQEGPTSRLLKPTAAKG